jgi:hypothetical protein
MHEGCPCTGLSALRRPHSAALALRERDRRCRGRGEGGVTVGGGTRDGVSSSCMWYASCRSRFCPWLKVELSGGGQASSTGFATSLPPPIAAHADRRRLCGGGQPCSTAGPARREGRSLHGDARHVFVVK